jgi:hypothetical protein
MSRGVDGVDGVDGIEGGDGLEGAFASMPTLDPFGPFDPFDPLDSLATSTASICRASAVRCSGDGEASFFEARWARTPAPSRAMAEKKRSAWRSEGVTVAES